jgi:hypothetical protein
VRSRHDGGGADLERGVGERKLAGDLVWGVAEAARELCVGRKK